MHQDPCGSNSHSKHTHGRLSHSPAAVHWQLPSAQGLVSMWTRLKWTAVMAWQDSKHWWTPEGSLALPYRHHVWLLITHCPRHTTCRTSHTRCCCCWPPYCVPLCRRSPAAPITLMAYRCSTLTSKHCTPSVLSCLASTAMQMWCQCFMSWSTTQAG